MKFSRCPAPFFCQGFFYGAGMENDAKAFSDSSGERRGFKMGLCANKLLQVEAHRRREFACFFRATLLGQKPPQSFLSEVLVRLINSGSREAKIRGRLSNRTTIDIDSSNRFVFELHQIAGIKEDVFGEQQVVNFLWVAIEGATGSQRFDFL